MTDTELETAIDEATRRLREYDDKAPGALFDELVGYGFIDREGRVTTLLGGDAQMEPNSRPPVPTEPE